MLCTFDILNIHDTQDIKIQDNKVHLYVYSDSSNE